MGCSTRFAFVSWYAYAYSLALSLAFVAGSAQAGDANERPADRPTSIVRRMHLPPVTQLQLENGLTVVLEEDHQAPFVAMRLAYKAGWACDPPGKTGLAALTQRVMTMMATRHVPAGMYDEWLERAGAFDVHWLTTMDWTSILATVPTTAIPVVLWLWSDQMGFFAPDDAKLLAETREIAKNEHAEQVDDVAYGAVSDIELRALYPEGHPYHATFSPAAIDGMTAADVKSFHDRYFTPADAVLVLAGDFDSSRVVEQVKSYFGPIPSGPTQVAPIPRAGFEGSPRLDVVASVQSPLVVMSWRTPAFMDAGDAELDVVARLLAGPRNSWVAAYLIGRGLTTSVSVRQFSRALGSFFEVRAMVAPGHTPDEVVAAIDGVLQQTAAAPDHFIVDTTRSVVAGRLQELDRLAVRARLRSEYLFLRRDPDWLENELNRYEAISPQAVRDAVKRWLRPERRVLLVVTPDPRAPRAGVLASPQAAP